MSKPPGETETVKVIVRIRPMNNNERSKGKSFTKINKILYWHIGSLTCLKTEAGYNQVSIFKPEEKANNKTFSFDAVYDMDSIQSVVYDESGFPLVESVVEGYNGTIFAYG